MENKIFFTQEKLKKLEIQLMDAKEELDFYLNTFSEHINKIKSKIQDGEFDSDTQLFPLDIDNYLLSRDNNLVRWRDRVSAKSKKKKRTVCRTAFFNQLNNPNLDNQIKQKLLEIEWELTSGKQQLKILLTNYRLKKKEIEKFKKLQAEEKFLIALTVF
ncbi:hypothetical protein A6A19_00395 [Actinobacillus delphinicola]|uniref:hypothetical protein n=1 Tax=Actinobacillus delphinicola TaxID=51161 RepID=UPI0024435CCA|nr:hypothetical protein [Actinobacillus delphinicola]MDG6896505.1 hypothetical protein [Actinobacillus delphinicola]